MVWIKIERLTRNNEGTRAGDDTANAANGAACRIGSRRHRHPADIEGENGLRAIVSEVQHAGIGWSGQVEGGGPRHGVGVVKLQHTVAVDRDAERRDGAGSVAVQRAGIDDRAADISIDALQLQCARAGIGEKIGRIIQAADGARQDDIARAANGRIGSQGDGNGEGGSGEGGAVDRAPPELS